jgi:DNA-binding transcriptional MerR regulator
MMIVNSAADTATQSWSISQLANELGISTRTIRFYEEKGLVKPARTSGNQRVYHKRDRARLKLILRGKHFGYSLNEIAEMIGMDSVNLDEVEQIKRSLAYGDKKLREIDQRMAEMGALRDDLQSVRRKLLDKLRELEKGGSP